MDSPRHRRKRNYPQLRYSSYEKRAMTISRIRRGAGLCPQLQEPRPWHGGHQSEPSANKRKAKPPLPFQIDMEFENNNKTKDYLPSLLSISTPF